MGGGGGFTGRCGQAQSLNHNKGRAMGVWPAEA